MAAKKRSLSVGVIGTGWVAGAHIENFKKIAGCTVVAVCSRNKSRAETKIAEHSLDNATGYDDVKQMLLREEGKRLPA